MNLNPQTPPPDQLDAVFAALADPTRRAILTRLMDGEANVGELSEPFAISQPAISKHLKVLEKAGLVERDIDKQRRPARLNAQNLANVAQWISEFERFWTGSFDQLDTLLNDIQNEEKNSE